jgi:hypothetical protein
MIFLETDSAIVCIVTIGLTPKAVGNNEESATYKFWVSQVSPVGFVAEVFGDLPIRLYISSSK